MIAILGLLFLVIASGVLIGLPLLVAGEDLSGEVGSGRGRSRAAAPVPAPDFAQLRDLEYDFRSGKMSREDYQAARADLGLARDGFDPRTTPGDGAEADLEAAIEAEAEAEAAIRAEAAGAQPAGAQPAATFCPNCGARLLRADQRFCHQCGSPAR
ncbi:MAG TPA: zinc ribbon domain-containing protein [Bacillota bacterium]